jgi:hypothetical protein
MPGSKSISVSSQLFVVRGLLIVGFISMLMVSPVGEFYIFIISGIIATDNGPLATDREYS